MTQPLPFTWPWALLFWTTYVWVFIPEFGVVSRARGSRSEEDRGSLRVVAIAFSVAVSLAFLIAFVVEDATFSGNLLGWFIAGIVLLIAASLLRRHCFRVLGHFFTGAVTIQGDHRLIETGAYRWVRHPSYSAAFLMILGIGLALGNWLSTLVALAVAFPAYDYRARVEEQALRSALGEHYERFMASRKRFVPFVY